jgi:hypothetical protein
MMKRAILTCLAVLSFVPMVCLSKEEKRFAPLRQQILAAKTVFLAGGPPDVLDKANETLATWGRFQVASDPAQADVVFEFAYGPATTPGLWSESLTITDAKTKEVLYEDGRVISQPIGAGPVIISAFRHYSMARDMLKDLRKRIEATESARTFEYAIQLETRAAKYFADAAALDEKLVMVWPASADSLRKAAMNLKKFADQLLESKTEMTQFLARATADDLLRKDNSGGVKRHRDEILAYTCSQLGVAKDIYQPLDTLRSNLSPDVVQALDTEKVDEALLSADCSSELAISLMKEHAGKPPNN